jgi:hypothetical protein
VPARSATAIISDRDTASPPACGRVTNLLSINHKFSTAYHPELTARRSARMTSSSQRSVRHYITDSFCDKWDKFLAPVEFVNQQLVQQSDPARRSLLSRQPRTAACQETSAPTQQPAYHTRETDCRRGQACHACVRGDGARAQHAGGSAAVIRHCELILWLSTRLPQESHRLVEAAWNAGSPTKCCTQGG